MGAFSQIETVQKGKISESGKNGQKSEFIEANLLSIFCWRHFAATAVAKSLATDFGRFKALFGLLLCLPYWRKNERTRDTELTVSINTFGLKFNRNFFNLGQSWPLFLYFRLFNTADSKWYCRWLDLNLVSLVSEAKNAPTAQQPLSIVSKIFRVPMLAQLMLESVKIWEARERLWPSW